MTAPKRVRLIAKTNKGKSRIGNAGEIWNVDERIPLQITPQPRGLFIQSLDGRDCRWVDPIEDPNFIVEVLED